MSLISQSEAISRLNKQMPKEMLPRSGNISPQNFSKKNKDGAFQHRQMNGKRKLFDWKEVAGAYGLSLISREDSETRAKAKAQQIVDQVMPQSKSTTDVIIKEFTATLKSRLQDATTAKQEIEIERMSYDSLHKQLEVQEKIGNLISMDDAKSVSEYTIGNIKAKSYELPVKYKTLFPQLRDKDITIMLEMTDKIFEDLHRDDTFG